MAEPETIDDAIEQNALGPAKVTVAGQTVEQHSISDQIKAQDHADKQEAKNRKGLGLHFRKIVPPGAG